VGVQIWRIEQFKVMPYPQEHYGEFYDGDAYIVLHTYGQPPNFNYDIFFWLGENCTQDEAGTAAYKTVELDDFHKGTAVQHREVQGYEDQLFTSLFPKGVHILKGGVQSGFRHVTPEQYQPRLYHVRGGFKDTRVQEVALARESLNSGDVFILDDGLTIYQWHGAKAPGMERLKATQFVENLKEQRNGRAQVHSFDEPHPQHDHKFWNLLGGHGAINAPEHAVTQNAPHVVEKKLLYKLSDNGGRLTFVEVANGTVHKKLLEPNDAFVFDSGGHVYVWVGRNADNNVKRNALGYATKFLADHNLPPHTPITRIPEGAHNAEFNAAFDH